nr:UDP-N-acetylmuramate dehydrogenase [Rhabdothermincola salaria]
MGPIARADVPLGPLTTYRVGGPAALLVADAGLAELARVADVVRATGVQVLVVGRGSNLLVADDGFPGIAVTLGDSLAEVILEGTTVVAGGGAALPVVARRTAAAGLTGFEWAVGVPGSVGGAVRMNAGGHGSDMAASLVRVRVLDLATGEDGWMPAAALDLGYRCSALTATQVVVAAELALAAGEARRAEAELSGIVRWRRAHQPGGANAGSVFTNPPGDSAGRLIEAAGLKGHRVGRAHVSTKHANFIQVDDDGSAADVAALMAAVRAAVRANTGVDLHAETRLVGFAPEVVAAAGATPDNPRQEVEG